MEVTSYFLSTSPSSSFFFFFHNAMHCSPAPQISSKISFLCCSGAEHYVNLVIGIGPSPLYGPLSSRSTWLGKEDGMKINEGRRIQEGLPPSLSLALSSALFTMWRFRKSGTSCPISLRPPPPLISSLLPPSPALTCELWTPSSSVPGRQRVPGFDWCQSSSHSFLPFDLKGRRRGPGWKGRGAAHSKIDFPTQSVAAASAAEWQGSPLCRFI